MTPADGADDEKNCLKYGRSSETADIYFTKLKMIKEMEKKTNYFIQGIFMFFFSPVEPTKIKCRHSHSPWEMIKCLHNSSGVPSAVAHSIV